MVFWFACFRFGFGHFYRITSFCEVLQYLVCFHLALGKHCRTGKQVRGDNQEITRSHRSDS